MVPIICILNHSRISWVSIEIYYHDNFVFGHIFMFLTSIFAHFCVLCTYLVGKQQEAYGESNHGMLFICQFQGFPLGAILVHARHRETTGVLNGSPQIGLDYCCICGIWLLFRVEGGFYFLYFWILDPGF